MLRWLIPASALVAAVAFSANRPPPVTSEAANHLLATCLIDRLEGCSIENESHWAEFSRQQFQLARAPMHGVDTADYEFVSPDGRYCAFVQFGKNHLSFVRTAEFYRCANRSRVTLGVG